LIRLRRAIEDALAGPDAMAAGGLVVDFGCGDMPYRSMFEAHGARYLGFDIEPTAPNVIRPGERLAVGDGSADLVVSFQVLEHVWDLSWYLGECRRVLKPTGALWLSTHGSWLYHPHPADYRRWTRDGLVKELEDRGFRIERIIGVMGPLAWTTQFRLLGYREFLRRVPLVRLLLLPGLIVAMNLRMEIEDAITPAWIRDTNACIYVVIARPAD
jgi:SAM-dependent methyltransferase